MTLTDFDPPVRLFSATGRQLAVVRSSAQRFAEDRLAAALNHARMDGRTASADDVVAHPRRFRGLVVLADSPLAAAPLLARLRATLDGVLLPILVWLHDRSGALVDPEWTAYADVMIDDRSPQAEIVAGLVRLRRVGEVRATLASPADALPAVRRQLAMLQFLASRELGRLDPRRAASRPLGHSLAPLDLLGGDGPTADLDALARLGLLRTTFFDQINLCPTCADARLAFREVCAGCRSSDVRRGEVLHHYACGQVAPEERFWRDGALACPSCGQMLRHVGIDYERPAALFYCNACGLAGGEGITLARCLECGGECTADEVGARVLSSYQLTADGLAAARSGTMGPP